MYVSKVLCFVRRSGPHYFLCYWLLILLITRVSDLIPDENIVDWDMHELDKEPNETHEEEPNTNGLGNLHEFLTIWLGTFLDQMHGITSKLFQWLQENFLETFLFRRHDCLLCLLLVAVCTPIYF
jgi:hypothetical protein